MSSSPSTFDPSDPAAPSTPAPPNRRLGHLALLAMGIVYGDIGTSPLYAIRECFYGPHAVPVNHANILGVLSLVVWTIVILVTIKYHVYVIRADNHGEGGILALMALVRSVMKDGRVRAVMVVLGLFGAALLYGDGALTPAISVLSAVEGLSVATPVFDPYVVPITVAILVALFLAQRRGTGGIGIVFGPIVLVWFATLAVLGVIAITHEPHVLVAVNPIYAFHFLLHNGEAGFLVLGAVFLVATGGEALYADLGHFGERPIQIDWFCVVGPALLLNYFGQGALLLHDPQTAHNPFYSMVPAWGLYPLVAIATAATVIASQAVISGVFSLTRQAIQLGYLPRMEIIHTSAHEIGQIYIPGANWLLMIATLALVVTFKSSSNLASAYGVAITTTMVITTTLAFPVSRWLWHWPLPVALLVTGFFLTVDLAFFGANIVKVAQGGWVPLLMAAAVYAVMTTWHRGRQIIAQRVRGRLMPVVAFIDNIRSDPPHRVPGTAVFLTGNPDGVPLALVHNLKHNKVLHQRVVFLTLAVEAVPHVPPDQHITLTDLGDEFYQVVAKYGFMEDPDVPDLLDRLAKHGLKLDTQATSFFLGRETLLVAAKPAMPIWRERLFLLLSRNAQAATLFFRIPPNRVVEVGAQIEI